MAHHAFGDPRKSGERESNLGAVRSSPIIAVAVALALSGCVTAKKYRLANADTPAAQPLQLSVTSAPLEITLVTVIVFKGPGSWKREARWDEYQLVLVNNDEEPLFIDSAELIDVQGQTNGPGEDPWKLEKMSRTNWDKYGKTGLQLVAGVGAAAAYGSAVVATGGAVAASGAAAGGAAALVGVIPIVGLMEISGVALINHDNKVKVQTEFQRRRLKFSLTVNSGEPAAGSLFFPMTPGPQRLIIHGHEADRQFAAVLELASLASLHLKAAAR